MKKIICQWKRDGKCIVQPDGQVFRCCYLKIHFERNSFKAKEHPIMKEYLDNIEDYNVKNKKASKYKADDYDSGVEDAMRD